MQYAWLWPQGGMWHLVTAEPSAPVRIWDDLGTAIRELASEGWAVHEEQETPLHRRFRGYLLERAVQ